LNIYLEERNFLFQTFENNKTVLLKKAIRIIQTSALQDVENVIPII
jgi:hypothetical protein